MPGGKTPSSCEEEDAVGLYILQLIDGRLGKSKLQCLRCLVAASCNRPPCMACGRTGAGDRGFTVKSIGCGRAATLSHECLAQGLVAAVMLDIGPFSHRNPPCRRFASLLQLRVILVLIAIHQCRGLGRCVNLLHLVRSARCYILEGYVLFCGLSLLSYQE